jgi:hypothetical protein
MRLLMIFFAATALFLVAEVSAQSSIELVLPQLMGKSIWAVENQLGRPDSISQTQRTVTYRYYRRGLYISIYFRAEGDQWIADDYYLSQSRRLR